MHNIPQQWRYQLEAGMQSVGIEFAPDLIDRLLYYVQLLQQWNAAYNLTAVREPLEMIGKHLLDSLVILPEARCRRLIDVGTGAGLPGIPLALAGACETALLIDSNNKKIRFCRHAIAELGLKGIEAKHARVEQVPAAEGGDVVVSRAFSSLRDFALGAGHLVQAGGRLLAMKGKRPEAELLELPAQWQLTEERELRVPGVEGERVVLTCRRS